MLILIEMFTLVGHKLATLDGLIIFKLCLKQIILFPCPTMG